MAVRHIEVLDSKTIDKIAAGEVVERPASVVKELLENAIDAGATAITVEIKSGGTSLIRVTDNGEGIDKTQVRTAFLRHATSKIKSVEDLFTIRSLGFRGEALSSIAAVSQVELITKTKEAVTGVRYVIEGAKEKVLEDIGAPEGTTFLVRNLFYNTPARQKFLKTPTTEASYITELMERISMSHPDIAFKYMNQGQLKLQTSGNNKIQDIIYQIYGREISSKLLMIEEEFDGITMKGEIGKPEIARSNRKFEHFFVNGRYIKSSVITRALEEAYKAFLMLHKYPFAILYFSINPELIDVNVHPNKMEIRFLEEEKLYQNILKWISETLSGKDMIPVEDDSVKSVQKNSAAVDSAVGQIHVRETSAPEPFELKRIEKNRRESMEIQSVSEDASYGKIVLPSNEEPKPMSGNVIKANQQVIVEKASQLELFEDHFLTKEAIEDHKILGQIFDTYWLVSFSDKLFMIDQHAAHEKVIYERMMKRLREKKSVTQSISPPMIISLSKSEQETALRFEQELGEIGFVFEPFGGNEFSVSGIPADLYGMQEVEMFYELLDGLSAEHPSKVNDAILAKIASMSCKSAVKGNQRLSEKEAKYLIEELLLLDNPYNCPHGRPTIIAFTKYEIERKFKRII